VGRLVAESLLYATTRRGCAAFRYSRNTRRQIAGAGSEGADVMLFDLSLAFGALDRLLPHCSAHHLA
jgi:hypothetical protein